MTKISSTKLGFFKRIFILNVHFLRSPVTVEFFILKGSTGCSVLDIFDCLDTVVGRAALHVAVLRGTGHGRSLAVPRTRTHHA